MIIAHSQYAAFLEYCIPLFLKVLKEEKSQNIAESPMQVRCPQWWGFGGGEEMPPRGEGGGGVGKIVACISTCRFLGVLYSNVSQSAQRGKVTEHCRVTDAGKMPSMLGVWGKRRDAPERGEEVWVRL